MDIEEEREMVGDKVLARYSKIKWIPLLELPPHRLQAGLRDFAGGHSLIYEISSSKDIVPDFISHLFGFDIQQSRCIAENVLVEEVSGGVICDIYSAVFETFDKKLRVPRQLQSQSIRTCASPLVEPVEYTFESVFRLLCEGIEAMVIYVVHEFQSLFSS